MVLAAKMPKSQWGRDLIGRRKFWGFSKGFSQQISTVFQEIFSRLSVDYRAEQEERKFCVLAKLLFYEFLEEEGK